MWAASHAPALLSRDSSNITLIREIYILFQFPQVLGSIIFLRYGSSVRTVSTLWNKDFRIFFIFIPTETCIIILDVKLGLFACVFIG